MDKINFNPYSLSLGSEFQNFTGIAAEIEYYLYFEIK